MVRSRETWLFLIYLLCALSMLDAVNARIIDVDNVATEVQNLEIDYTHYPSFGKVVLDVETNGIRNDQEVSSELIPWAEIAKLDVIGEIGNSGRAKAIVLSRDGQNSSTRILSNSEKGAFGDTEFGRFQIALRNIRTILILDTTEVRELSYKKIQDSNRNIASFEILDSSGALWKVSNIEIDYSNIPSFGLFTPYFEKIGIKVIHGKGTLTVRWDLLEQIAIHRMNDTNFGFAQYAADFSFSDDQRLTWQLARYSLQGLLADTKYGKLRITPSLVATITIQRGEDSGNPLWYQMKGAGRGISGYSVFYEWDTAKVNFIAIDYTNYSTSTYIEDVENNGIRIDRGSGVETIPWTVIKKITITARNGTRISGEIAFRNGESMICDFEQFSKKGMIIPKKGSQVSIPLGRLQAIDVLLNMESN